jgi:hypothetical protein
MHDVNDWPGNHRFWNEALCAPQVIRDDMPPVQNQHDGRIYTSKRAMRASYLPSGNKEGVRLIEVGTEKQKPKPKYKPDARSIRTSMEKAQAALNRGEVTRETYERKVITRPGPI